MAFEYTLFGEVDCEDFAILESQLDKLTNRNVNTRELDCNYVLVEIETTIWIQKNGDGTERVLDSTQDYRYDWLCTQNPGANDPISTTNEIIITGGDGVL